MSNNEIKSATSTENLPPSEKNLKERWVTLQKMGLALNDIRYSPDGNPISAETEREDGESGQTQSIPLGRIESPTELYSLSRIVIHEEARLTLEACLAKMELADFLNNDWDLKSIDAMGTQNIINLYGPPGTGKTLAARAIANSMKKRMLVVDYASLEDKHVGVTEKNISTVFRIAREQDLILFLDEGDTLTSKRIEEASSQAKFINAARNVFMQELDKFNGVVIITTNLFENFDAALLRRIQQHVKFELPSEAMREKILTLHIPQAVKLNADVNLSEIAKLSEQFSGGDLKNLAKEAMVGAANEFLKKGELNKAELCQRHLLLETSKIKKSKSVHSGEAAKKEIRMID